MGRFGAYSLVLVALTACIPYGFTGGGLPSHIRTVAIVPFDNQTATPELPGEITDALRTKLHDRLGLRDASEAKATASVRGTVQRYEIDIPIGYSATKTQATTAQRARFATTKPDDQITTRLAALADTLQLPPGAELIAIQRSPTVITISSDYDEVIKLPMKKEQVLHFHPTAASRL